MKNARDIFEYITEQEAAYKLPIKMNDSWDWSMQEHIRTTENYANSQLNNGKNDYTPVKNITRPILNLQHRAEDVDVKDVQIYVDNPDKYHLSLLVKKYHDDVYIQKHNLDEFFDELGVSRIDLGLGVAQKRKNGERPRAIPLQSIVFCNQRDILASPFGILHEYGVDQLFEMEKYGWGDPNRGATHSVSELVALWREEDIPSEGIKVYEVHGSLPKRFADPTYEGEEYETRMFICAFYQPKGDGKRGVILYTAPEDTLKKFKQIKRDPIYGRACGFGAAEELFEPQVWVNYDMIRMQRMLDAASIVLLTTDDPTMAGKHPNGFKGMENLELIERTPGTSVGQIDTFPRNLSLFEKSIANWEAHAQQMGAANDAIMGESPSSGTPFKLQELVVQEAHGLHEYRRNQFARHIEEIYRDWIIPDIKREITAGTKFLSELSVDELNYVAERVATNEWNKEFKRKVLSGQSFLPGEMEDFMARAKDDFKKGGNKRFIEILRDEFKDSEFAVKVSVSGKTKNLAQMTDKLVNIFRFMFSNPQGFQQVMQMPGMASSFNKILEYSGLSPVDFTAAALPKMEVPKEMGQEQKPPAVPELQMA